MSSYVDVVFKQGDVSISALDLGLALESYKNPLPEIKTRYQEIPGASGALDFTECFGGIQYKHRLVTLQFGHVGDWEEWDTVVTAVAEKIHGRTFDVYIEVENGWYYSGRAAVQQERVNDVDGTIVITVTAWPYRHRKKGEELEEAL